LRDGFSIESAVEKGRHLPEWYLVAPATAPGDEFYLEAFYNLCSERKYDGGPSPRSSILQFSRDYGLDPTLINPLISIVDAMDVVYLRWVETEREKRAKEKASMKKQPGKAPVEKTVSRRH
jgi:hypothetical protein